MTGNGLEKTRRAPAKIVIIAVLYIAFTGVGLPNSLLGTAWPSMQTFVGVPSSYAGWITLAIAIGMFVASLVSERVIIVVGDHRTMTLSFVFILIAMLGFSATDVYFLLLASAVALGIGIGFMESAANGYVVKNLSSRHMNWMHCFWGVGAAIGPLFMAKAIESSTYRAGYRQSAIVELAILILLFACASQFRKDAEQGENDDSYGDGIAEAKGKSLRSLLARPGAVPAVFSFFLYCSVEMTVMLWGSSYMVMAKGVGASEAAGWMSVFFIGMVVGRIVAGAAAGKLNNKALVGVGLAISALSVAVILLAGTPMLLSAGFFVLGFGFGPVFPSLLHATAENFGPEYAQAMVGAQLAAAFLGNAIIPLIVGGLAQSFGYGLFPFTLIILLALLVGSAYLLFRRANAKGAV